MIILKAKTTHYFIHNKNIEEILNPFHSEENCPQSKWIFFFLILSWLQEWKEYRNWAESINIYLGTFFFFNNSRVEDFFLCH